MDKCEKYLLGGGSRRNISFKNKVIWNILEIVNIFIWLCFRGVTGNIVKMKFGCGVVILGRIGMFC